jgi:hypothetical protein
MITILDKLFKKRFCLPAYADISDYENGNNSVNACYCGNYNHIACVFKGKDRYIEQG